MDAQTPGPGGLAISRSELWWLTLGAWVGGVSLLTLLPVLLIPRLGIPLGMAGSYLVFFVAWQPVQTITQRAVGTPAAVLRMIVLVGSGAVVAFYLREWLLSLSRS